jgi:sugar phosphate permease
LSVCQAIYYGGKINLSTFYERIKTELEDKSMTSEDNSSYKWVILLIFFFSQISLSIAGYGWGALAPFLKKVMSLSITQLGAITSTICFTSALAAFPGGIIVDRFGVKKGLLLWLGITGFSLLFLSFIHFSYSFLIIMVAIAGTGYGLGNPVASKGIFIWFEEKRRGTAFGIRQSAVSIGCAIAGVLLVYLSEKSGPFIALRDVCWFILTMFVLAFLLYKTPKLADDILSTGGSQGKQGSGMGLKILFSNRALLILSLVAAFIGMSQGVVAAFFIIYLNESLGYSLLEAGSLFTIVMIGGAVGRILWGTVSDSLFDAKRKPVLMIICCLGLLSITIFTFWVASWPQWIFIAVIIGIGLSSWGWNGILFVIVAEIADEKRTAASVGLASTIGWIGISLGPLVFGCITDHFGYFYAWLSMMVMCAFSLFLSFLLNVPKQTDGLLENAMK